MKGIVDRIEENIIVIEYDEKMYNVDSFLIHEQLDEGDVVEIIIQDNKIASLKKDLKGTLSRKEYINKLTKDMWQ